MLTELTQKIDRAIADNLENQMTSGIVTLVYLEGKPVYAKAAGMADIESGIPMQENTLFRFASISKAFTSFSSARSFNRSVYQLGSGCPHRTGENTAG